MPNSAPFIHCQFPAPSPADEPIMDLVQRVERSIFYRPEKTPMITSAEVTDALVLKLKAAGFEIDPETVTSAEVLEMLNTAEIAQPPRLPLITQLTEALEGARNILEFDLAHCHPTSAAEYAEMERQTYRDAIATADAALLAVTRRHVE